MMQPISSLLLYFAQKWGYVQFFGSLCVCFISESPYVDKWAG